MFEQALEEDATAKELLSVLTEEELSEFLGAVELSMHPTRASDAARTSGEVVILFI